MCICQLCRDCANFLGEGEHVEPDAWKSLREAQRLFTEMGVPDRVADVTRLLAQLPKL